MHKEAGHLNKLNIKVRIPSKNKATRSSLWLNQNHVIEPTSAQNSFHKSALIFSFHEKDQVGGNEIYRSLGDYGLSGDSPNPDSSKIKGSLILLGPIKAGLPHLQLLFIVRTDFLDVSLKLGIISNSLSLPFTNSTLL